MIKLIKQWLVNAISNGGAVLVVAAVLLAGAAGEAAKPVSRLVGWTDGGGVAREPVSLEPISGYLCPDTTWARAPGFSTEDGSAFIVCKKNNVVIRHFDRVAAGVNQDHAMDQGVYPFADLPSVDEAVRIANSR